MEDTIEICSGCGKMPRAIDNTAGQFICSRCGNHATIHVNADNYEKLATELDMKFHMNIQKKRIEEAASAPVETARSRPAAKKAKNAPAKGKKSSKKGKKPSKKR